MKNTFILFLVALSFLFAALVIGLPLWKSPMF